MPSRTYNQPQLHQRRPSNHGKATARPGPGRPDRSALNWVQENRAPDSRATLKKVKVSYLEKFKRGLGGFLEYLQADYPELVGTYHRVFKTKERAEFKENEVSTQRTTPKTEDLQRVVAETEELAEKAFRDVEQGQANIRAAMLSLEEEARLKTDLLNQQRENEILKKNLEKEMQYLEKAKIKRRAALEARKKEIEEYHKLEDEKQNLKKEYNLQMEIVKERGNRIIKREDHLQVRENRLKRREKDLYAYRSRVIAAENSFKRTERRLNEEEKKIHLKLKELEKGTSEDQLRLKAEEARIEDQWIHLKDREQEFLTESAKLEARFEALRSETAKIDELSDAMDQEKARIQNHGETLLQVQKEVLKEENDFNSLSEDREVSKLTELIAREKLEEAKDLILDWHVPAIDKSCKRSMAAAIYCRHVGIAMDSHRYLIKAAQLSEDKTREELLEMMKKTGESDLQKLRTGEVSPNAYLNSDRCDMDLISLINHLLTTEFKTAATTDQQEEFEPAYVLIRQILETCRDLTQPQLGLEKLSVE